MTARALLILAALLPACSSDRQPPPLEACEDCSEIVPGKQGGGAASSVTDAAIPETVEEDAAAKLSGRVEFVADEHFVTRLKYKWGGNILIRSASSGVHIPFGWQGHYSTPTAIPGNGWFSIYPDSAYSDAGTSPSILITHAYRHFPSQDTENFWLPVLGRPVFESIYSTFPGKVTPRADAAQVVFAFTRNNKPVAGVKLSHTPKAEVVAYDDINGYSTTYSTTTTGVYGVAIAANVTGVGDFGVTTDKGFSYSFPVIYGAGEASFILLDLP